MLRGHKLNADELAERELDIDAPLPWDRLDMGVTKEYLQKELQRSNKGKFTPMCFDNCKRCGVSCLMKNFVLEQKKNIWFGTFPLLSEAGVVNACLPVCMDSRPWWRIL